MLNDNAQYVEVTYKVKRIFCVLHATKEEALGAVRKALIKSPESPAHGTTNGVYIGGGITEFRTVESIQFADKKNYGEVSDTLGPS